MTMMFLPLRYAIRIAGYDYQSFAGKIGLKPQQLSNRLNGRVPWTVPEAERACKALNRSADEIGTLFIS